MCVFSRQKKFFVDVNKNGILRDLPSSLIKGVYRVSLLLQTYS